MITLSARVTGKRKNIARTHSICLPVEVEKGEKNLALRGLIAHIVTIELEAFKQRREDNKIIWVLTESEIKEGEESGRIFSGGREEEEAEIDEKEAVETAIQAFKDGLYYVFIDKNQIENLDDTVILKEESEVTFLRLVALSGG